MGGGLFGSGLASHQAEGGGEIGLTLAAEGGRLCAALGVLPVRTLAASEGGCRLAIEAGRRWSNPSETYEESHALSLAFAAGGEDASGSLGFSLHLGSNCDASAIPASAWPVGGTHLAGLGKACDLLAPGSCPTALGCYPDSATSARCQIAGWIAAGGLCARTTQCVPGTACAEPGDGTAAQRCVPLCKTAGGGSACATGKTCTAAACLGAGMGLCK